MVLSKHKRTCLRTLQVLVSVLVVYINDGEKKKCLDLTHDGPDASLLCMYAMGTLSLPVLSPNTTAWLSVRLGDAWDTMVIVVVGAIVIKI